MHDAKLEEIKKKLTVMDKADNPVLYRVMQEVVAEAEAGDEAFAPHTSGTEGGRFSSHWSHSSGIVTDAEEG